LHLVVFIVKIFVTMHGHMNVKGVGACWFRNFRLANIHAVFLFPTQLAPYRLTTNSPSI